MEMELAAIIIARGGSRRLLRKNILRFCGKPLVEWSIIQAQCARCLTDKDIYLSTDDDEIAIIGERCGIQVIRRPDWPDADLLSGGVPISHAIGEIEKQRPLTHFFALLPTTVCRLPENLDRVLEQYRIIKLSHEDCHAVAFITPRRETVVYERNHDTVRVVLFDKHFRYYGPGPAMAIEEVQEYKGRDAPKSHTDAMTDAAVAGAEGELEAKIRKQIYKDQYYVMGHWYQAFDIDDQDMFELNEILFKRYILKDRGEAVYWDYKNGKEK